MCWCKFDWKDSSCLGTNGYMAPEVVERKKYSYAIDLWSCGIVFFEMSTGELPFASLFDDTYVDFM